MVEYKEVRGYKMGYCPICGADLHGCFGDTIFNEDVGFEYTCANCGANGTECYILEPIESIAFIEE